jgi:hypothetical protein
LESFEGSRVNGEQVTDQHRTTDERCHLSAESIYPRLVKTQVYAATEERPATHYFTYEGGFSKREYIAVAAMSGLCANSVPGSHHVPQNLVKEAVELADMLLQELAK